MKKVKAWADVGSHGGIFEFVGGPVAERYPFLMQIYSQQIRPDLKPVEIRILPTPRRSGRRKK